MLVHGRKSIALRRLTYLRLVRERSLNPGEVLEEVRTSGPDRPLAGPVYLSAEKWKKFAKLIELMKDRGFPMAELAQASGYESSAALSRAIKAGKISPEAYTRAVEYAESEAVKARILAAGALPIASGAEDRTTVHRLTTTRDLAGLAVQQLRQARGTLESGLDRKVFRSILEPGIQRVARSIEKLEAQLEELLI